MTTTPFVADRQSALDAARLLAEFGAQAVGAAVAQADISRDRGNVVHFCRWRQIAMLIELLRDTGNRQTRH